MKPRSEETATTDISGPTAPALAPGAALHIRAVDAPGNTTDAADIEVRVRYAECDSMGVAHHSVYPVWLEIARTELLRRRGIAYRDLEAAGVFFVVARLSLRYRAPARYDDLLQIHVKVAPCHGVKVEHEYQVRRGSDVLCTAQTTLVCVDRQGKLQPVPPGITPPSH